MWQQVLDSLPASARERFAFLAVAVDAEPECVRPFLEGLALPTAIDSTGLLGRLLDFDVVPNGLFLDEEGVIRFLHIGGFDVRRSEIREQVRALIDADFRAGEVPRRVVQEPVDVEVIRTELAANPVDAALRFALGEALLRLGRAAEAEAELRRAAELDSRDWSAPFALGTALRQQGRTEEALTAWREALRRDPPNFTVRKQIWRAEHPERFYPSIDSDWQKEQLTLEGYPPAPRG